MTAEGDPEGLDLLLAHAFRLLEQGASDRLSPFHMPVLGTVDREGRPQLRTVVLRAFDRAVPALRFHTDRRSPKWWEIEAQPAVSLLAYHPGECLQARMSARAGLHADDAVADDAWRGSRPLSRVCYGALPAPGTPIPAGDAFSLPQDAAAVQAGRENFGAVMCRIDRLDVLHLAHGGHRRAVFSWGEDGFAAGWLAP